jgi:hypothetical protein
MKVTRKQLQKIIAEETKKLLEYEQYVDDDGNIYDDEGNVTRRGRSFGRRYGGQTYGNNAPWQRGRSAKPRKTSSVASGANTEKISAVIKALEVKPNNFLKSILDQLRQGRKLSPKQNSIVKKIIAKSDPEAAKLFESSEIAEVRALVREALLNEGVYDPGILKAVFMAGGPGSGKSYTAREIFGGIKGSLAAGTAAGLKLVNSDPAFELNLKKMGVDPKTLGSMSDEEFDALTVGPDSPRGRAKRSRDVAQKTYTAGRLGLVIDGTGDDYEKIKKKKTALEDLGYDTYMVFVNTTEEVALERNRNRDRVLRDDLVSEIWGDVQANLGRFQGLFGAENIIIVDNTVYGPIPADIQKAVDKFIKAPVKNYRGKQWIENELRKKDRSGE